MFGKQHAALLVRFLLCGMKICAGGFRIHTPFTCLWCFMLVRTALLVRGEKFLNVMSCVAIAQSLWLRYGDVQLYHHDGLPQRLYAPCLFEHFGKHTWSGYKTCWWNPAPIEAWHDQDKTSCFTRVAPCTTLKKQSGLCKTMGLLFLICQYLVCASTCFWGCKTCCVCARTVLKCKMLLLDSPGQCGHTLSLYRQTTRTTVISTDNWAASKTR